MTAGARNAWVRRWRGGRGVVVATLAASVAGAETAGDRLRAQIAAAPPGARIEVAPGIHEGPFVIERPVRLQGEPGAVLEGSGRGHVVDIRAADVELSGFLIRRSGSDLSADDAGVHVSADRATIHGNTIVDTLHGIYLRKTDECRLTNNVIRGRAAAAAIADPLTSGLQLTNDELCSVELQQDQRGNGIHVWNGSRHLIARNDIRGTRDGIYFQFCDDARIQDNVIRDVRYGLHYMYSDGNTFEGNVFTRSAAGAAVMYSRNITLRRNHFAANRSHRAYGLLMHTVETTRIEKNLIEGNTVGAFVENSTANLFLANTVASNYIGLRLSDSSDENAFSANRFRGNVHAVETSGLRQENRFSIEGVGNVWDGAVRLDLNRDGIADVPHQETDLFGRWRRTFPEIGLLSGSPGERAIRFVHARLRVPGLPGVRDDHPLTRSPSR